METCEQRIYSPELIIPGLKDKPETYETILQGFCGSGTKQFVLRRKMSRLIKEGKLCKAFIPGSRFGKCIFYCLEKKYNILVYNDNLGSKVYFFKDYDKSKKFYLLVHNYFELDKCQWIYRDAAKVFFSGKVLMFI